MMNIQSILKKHLRYLHGIDGGVRVNLSNANLRDVNLRDARLPAPTMVLLAGWRGISEGTCALAMAYDASCHPDPDTFPQWARGDPCPYLGRKVQRACNFRESASAWDSDIPAPRPFDLMVRLIRETCVDSDYHVKQAHSGGAA